jgi:hypothetical protein
MKYDIWCIGCFLFDLTEAHRKQKIQNYASLCQTHSSIYSLEDIRSSSGSGVAQNTRMEYPHQINERIIKLSKEYKNLKKLFMQ